MPYKTQQFLLTMNGGEMPLTLYGIGTPQMILKADPNNLQPIYIGNIFDNGNGNQITTLDANNNAQTLRPGNDVIYGDTEQFDRLPRLRNFFIENNRRHIMSQWFAKGTAGDILIVTWLDENNPILNTSNQLIDVTSAGLTR